MKKTTFLSIIFTSLILIGLLATANAELWVDDARGLVYDTDLNITWLQDTHYAYNSGYNLSLDGRMTWNESMTWVSTLSYQGYDDWRLPITLIPDSNCSVNSSISIGVNCRGSEMGHLWYTELGNPVYNSSNPQVPNVGPFNFAQENYGYNILFWSGTDSPLNSNFAYYFQYEFGGQERSNKDSYLFAMAVRDGNSGITDPAIIPEPISTILFVTGGLILSGRRYFNR